VCQRAARTRPYPFILPGTARFSLNWLRVLTLILQRALEQAWGANRCRVQHAEDAKAVSFCEDEGINRSSTIATLSRTPTMLRKAWARDQFRQ
jgi:hypothetical protein